jgi:glycolate oxidase
MTTYNKVTDKIVKQLQGIVGSQFVIFDDPDQLEPYSHDEVTEKEYHSIPEAVVRPRNALEIAEVMKLANIEKIPVTPRGGGSGLSGGAVPIYGGIVLHMNRMNSILEIDTENMVAVVEPGVVTSEIDEAASEHGLFFAGYPMSLQSCFIGGNAAENAGGGKAVKYGVTGRYIIGIEVVTPEGKIVNYGGKLVKNVTGYDMIHLLVGSEGTLGVFTKITLKLLPRPAKAADLLVLFKDTESAIKVVPEIMTRTKIIPTAIEYMDRLSVHTTCKYLNENLPYKNAGAMLLIEVDGNSKAQLEEEYEIIGDLCEDLGALEIFVADNLTTRERIWNVRRNIGEAFNVLSPHQSHEDIVVPVAAITRLMITIEKLSKNNDIQIPVFGHAGDGNLHVVIVKNPEHSLEHWYEILPGLQHELFTKTNELGGVISGEHGIGNKRKKHIHYSLDENSIELMIRIKKAFDPNNILNPGKIFEIS